MLIDADAYGNPVQNTTLIYKNLLMFCFLLFSLLSIHFLSPPRMSAPYVNTRVRIQGLEGRADLNGQEGVATSYDSAAGRYVVQVGSSSMKLKPTNLEPLGSNEGGGGGGGFPGMGGLAGMMGGLPGMGGPQMAQAQAMAMGLMQKLQGLQGVLPPGIKPQTALYAALGVGLLLSYLVGAMRAVVFVASLGAALVIMLPAVRGGGGAVAIVRRAGGALGEQIAEQLNKLDYFTVSPRIGAAILLPVVTAVLYFVFSPLILARVAGGGEGAQTVHFTLYTIRYILYNAHSL
jgi:hypothetical protein